MHQLFFSHTQRPDKLVRNTHETVTNISAILKKKGWTIWIDKENIKCNIDDAMATGIDNSEVVLCF